MISPRNVNDGKGDGELLHRLQLKERLQGPSLEQQRQHLQVQLQLPTIPGGNGHQ